MSQTPPPPEPGASQAQDGWPRGAAIRVAIGAVLAAYYLRVLVAVVRHLPENLHWHAEVDYCAPWLPRLLGWLAPLGTGCLLRGLSWLVIAALVVGGIAMIANHRRGMQLGLIALGVSLVEDLLFGLPLSVAMAMGWIRISFTSPPRLAAMSARLRDLPPEAMRIGGAMVVAMTLVGMAVRAGLLVWLRRHLAATRPSRRG